MGRTFDSGKGAMKGGWLKGSLTKGVVVWHRVPGSPAGQGQTQHCTAPGRYHVPSLLFQEKL